MVQVNLEQVLKKIDAEIKASEKETRGLTGTSVYCYGSGYEHGRQMAFAEVKHYLLTEVVK